MARKNKKRTNIKNNSHIIYKGSLWGSTKKNIKDIVYVLKNLRQDDKEEVEKQLGKNYIQTCLKNIMNSHGRFIIGYAKEDNIPVCIGGCNSIENELGIVWLLCTEEICKHKNCILKNIKREIELYQKKHFILSNTIYCKNKLAKIWLKKLGFKFDNPFGIKTPEGFELFYKKKELRGLNNAASTAVS